MVPVLLMEGFHGQEGAADPKAQDLLAEGWLPISQNFPLITSWSQGLHSPRFPQQLWLQLFCSLCLLTDPWHCPASRLGLAGLPDRLMGDTETRTLPHCLAAATD